MTLSSNLGATLLVLDVSGCDDLRSIEVVRSCVQLRCLKMPGIGVTDFSPLAAACGKTLEELWMSHLPAAVVSLAPLKTCTRLNLLQHLAPFASLVELLGPESTDEVQENVAWSLQRREHVAPALMWLGPGMLRAWRPSS
jgi:CelD/BcsL family acetyltransferase involved in cellulose biosynthesis